MSGVALQADRDGNSDAAMRAALSAVPGSDDDVHLPSGKPDAFDPETFDPSAPEVAHVKRFFEVWMADAEFRDALLHDPGRAARARGLRVDPMAFRYLWDPEHRQQLEQEGLGISELLQLFPEATRQFFGWMRFSHVLRDRMRAQSRPVEPRFAAWRDRQIARSSTVFRPTYDAYTPHILFAIELSRGCSVGCWFCGVSAPKLEAQFLRTPGNRQMFVDVLSALRGVTGEQAGSWGFLYWATDPLDNPDFEKFCLDFQDVLGRFPVVTTAQPQRDLARTRALLQLARQRGADKIRFSITTLRLLAEIHKEFSAEELGKVDLIPINKGSLLQPSASGRARELYMRQGGDRLEWAMSTADTSISCVSGFLINMLDRSVKLITPCASSERWPQGYFVYAERTFADGADLERAIDEMIDRHMPLSPPLDEILRFRPDLAYRGSDDGFVLEGRYGQVSMCDNPLLRDVGDMIAQGTHTPRQIAGSFADAWGLDQSLPLGWIDQLFARGVIDEEPRPCGAA